MKKGIFELSAQAILSAGAVAFLSLASAFIVIVVLTGISLSSTTVGATEDHFGPDFVGSWQGRLDTGSATDLRIVLYLEASAERKLAARIDSPDQGAANIPVATVEVDNRTLRLGIEVLRAGFEGVLSADKTTIEGEWTQSGFELPLTLGIVPTSH